MLILYSRMFEAFLCRLATNFVLSGRSDCHFRAVDTLLTHVVCLDVLFGQTGFIFTTAVSLLQQMNGIELPSILFTQACTHACVLFSQLYSHRGSQCSGCFGLCNCTCAADF